MQFRVEAHVRGIERGTQETKWVVVETPDRSCIYVVVVPRDMCKRLKVGARVLVTGDMDEYAVLRSGQIAGVWV